MCKTTFWVNSNLAAARRFIPHPNRHARLRSKLLPFEFLGLLDKHLFDLSEWISEETELVELGLRLEVPRRKINSCVNNNSNDIQLATENVLQYWLKGQENRCEAYENLQMALRECKRNDMADELRKWVEERSTEPGSLNPSRESMLILCVQTLRIPI